MQRIFNKETVTGGSIAQDPGRLAELDSHELLLSNSDHGQAKQQIASFDSIRAIGSWFLSQTFNTVLPSTEKVPDIVLQSPGNTQQGVSLGRLALGSGKENQYPVTIEVVTTPTGKDLRIHIVPIHFGALEVAQFEQHTDSLLALAAAAAVAPQFILALEGGITTIQCSTKKDLVTSITPDHGTPLAVTFDAFDSQTSTLESAIAVTANPGLNIKQAAHLHGQNRPGTQQISRSASGSKIAAGVPIHTFLRNELPKHALFLQTYSDDLGNQRVLSMHESLSAVGIFNLDLSLLAAALGFTARVVGESKREKMVETLLQPNNADTPLVELVQD